MKLVNIIWGKFLWLFGLDKFIEKTKSYYISPFSFYMYISLLLVLPIGLVNGVINKVICLNEYLSFFSKTCFGGVLFEGISLWPILIAVALVILNLLCLLQAFFRPETERVKYVFCSKILQVFACIFFVLGTFFHLYFQ